jgi:hypothetical protein
MHRPITFLLILLLASACSQDFRELDERQMRRQFHVPPEVRLDTLLSHPDGPGGWFGREGLRIRAIFQFDEKQFRSYVRGLRDADLWSPVTFLNYSPDRAESSTARAREWRRLPVDGLPPQLAHVRSLFDSSVTAGYWYCNVLTYERGDSIPHGGGGYHYEWHTYGRHGSELLPGQHGVITVFGILDARRRRLSAWIGFSG